MSKCLHCFCKIVTCNEILVEHCHTYKALNFLAANNLNCVVEPKIMLLGISLKKVVYECYSAKVCAVLNNDAL